MSQKFSSGDSVTWSSGNGQSEGTVEERITKPKIVEGQKVNASEDNPRYLVKNNNTSKTTGHRPEVLSTVDDSSSNSGPDEFQEDDQVKWNTAQGKTTGTVKKKLTEPMTIKDYDVKASEDNPKYLVESDSTGAQSAHKPESLNPI